MNLAQWFMIIQMITCVIGAAGFLYTSQPWSALVWFSYGVSNIGWTMIAGGKA